MGDASARFRNGDAGDWSGALVRKMISVVAMLLSVALFAQGQGAASKEHTAKTLTLTQVWALDATYTDAQHGVTFHYPSVWQAETQFAYHPPALSRSDEDKPIAGFGYSEGGFPRGRFIGPYSESELEGVGFVYTAEPAASAAECEAKAASYSDSPKHTKVVIGGRTFSDYETGEGGMSQSISGDLYATYAQHTCYLFEADVAMVSAAVVDDIKPLDTAQMSAIFKRLTEIMKTVRIASKGADSK